jgi:hypothetical protein
LEGVCGEAGGGVMSDRLLGAQGLPQLSSDPQQERCAAGHPLGRPWGR